MEPATNTLHNVPGIGGPLGTTPGAAAAASNGSAQGLHAGDAASSGAPASHFEIAVADPVKQGEGVSAFVSYKVSCRRWGAGARLLLFSSISKQLEHNTTEHSVPHTSSAMQGPAVASVGVSARARCCCCRPMLLLRVTRQVRTRTDLPQYNRPTSEVIRRFRDFTHLEHLLAEKNK